jgi:pimeloyl-ACP methyl ester carboxylesterase
VPLEGTPRSIPAADGQLVSVGERRLWITCRGEGAPTVVMDAGVNSGSRIWSLVWPATSAATRVCIYDRAGLGRSDPIPRPRTSQEIVDDLHGLLENAGVPSPYVLVAHSFGGLNVRLYASQYPTDVVGMVLVDSVHEDRFAATAKVLTREQQAAFERDKQANPEGLDYYESSRLVRAIGPSLPNIPIIVIARGRADPWPRGYPVAELERVWRELQADLASRSPQATLVIAEQSDHNIPGNQSAIVIEQTRRVVALVRGK